MSRRKRYSKSRYGQHSAAKIRIDKSEYNPLTPSASMRFTPSLNKSDNRQTSMLDDSRLENIFEDVDANEIYVDVDEDDNLSQGSKVPLSARNTLSRALKTQIAPIPKTPISVGVPRRPPGFKTPTIQYEKEFNITPNLAKQYNIVKKLGQGGYGIVWLAEEKMNPNNQVAIKMISLLNVLSGLDYDIVNEISILKRLNHPNIIKLYQVDYDAKGGRIGLVLELADTDLRTLIYEVWKLDNISEEEKSQQIQEKLQITYDILCGLNYLHKNNIIHLDIKPHNILIKNNHVKIADFGLSDRINAIKSEGLSKVTWIYRSPELQCGGYYPNYDYNADTWSVGIMLIELFFKQMMFLNQYSRDEDTLYKNMIFVFGAPNSEWIKKYNRNKDMCPNYTATQLEQFPLKSLELGIFGTYPTIPIMKDKIHFFKQFYGPELYNQILDLISKCLRYDPQERIQFEEAINHPIFDNTLCNCKYCDNVSRYNLDVESAPKLNSAIESVMLDEISGQFKFIVPYGREIYRRVLLKNPAIAENDTIALKYQAIALNLACKILNADTDTLRYIFRPAWMKIANIASGFEFNELELQVSNAVDWNFDGPM